jgi:CRISPR-associated protein (TIGR03986 family)
MSQVKSTYNFVPAPNEQEVFKPHWADQVSHDVPFEDSESGEIEIEIIAETPIFIKNGYAKGKEDNEFSHVELKGEKKYFIPATSLKGMVRNVLEIVSFSRLNKDLVNDDKYAFRDLTRDSEYMNSYDSNKVCAGWLKQDKNESWTIQECKFNHIHHKDVDDALGTNFRELYLEKQPKEKTAMSKYEICGNKSLVSTFKIRPSKTKPRGIAYYDKDGKPGTVVFTGQSGPRKEKNRERPSGKVNEFVFLDGIIEEFKIDETQKKGFKFVYLDHDNNNISPDWKIWKKKLENGEKIPIFFNKNGQKVKHFGIAYMYKLPYENSVHDMLPLFKYEQSHDLATTIFGYTNDGSLKGRVFFGDIISNNAKLMKEQKDILGGPKASFTPFYLDQQDKNKVTTYQEKTSLKGFKRYPIHEKVNPREYSKDQLGNPKVFSSYKPVDKGAVFNGRIRYHNLKSLELGALISALSFHGTEEKLFHSLGGAKSFGFGRVKISIKNLSDFTHALQAFEYQMNVHCEKNLNTKWLKTKQIQELVSMSTLPPDNSEQLLVYPSIGKDGKNGTDDNEFIQIKKQRNFLQPYSNYNTPFEIKSLITEDVLDKWEKERKVKEEQLKKQQLELNKKINELKALAESKLQENEFEEAEHFFKQAISIEDDGSLPSFFKRINRKKIEYFKDKAFTSLSSQNFEEAIALYETVMKIEDDGSLEKFKKEVEIERVAFEEEKAFLALNENAVIEVLEDFIKQYPISKKRSIVEEKISKIKALSGIPYTVRNKDNFKQFADNTDNWVKKIKKDNGTIESLGFAEEHSSLLLKIIPNELADRRRARDFNQNNVLRRLNSWYSEFYAKELWQKIEKIINP